MEIEKMTNEELDLKLKELETRSAIADETEIEEITKEVEAIETRKAEIKAEFEKAEEERKAIAEAPQAEEPETIIEERINKTMDLKEIRSSKEYIDAFANYIKTGKDEEVRALLTDFGGGTIPTPTFVQEYVETAWSRSNIASKVKKLNVKGILKVPYEISSSDAAVHTEGAAAPDEEALVIGTATITPATIKKWIGVTDEVLGLHSEEFLRYIYDELTERIIKKLDENIVAAVAASTSPFTAAVDVAAIDATTILQGLAELADSANEPTIVMNKKVFFNSFMGLLDDVHRPIYEVLLDNERKPRYFLNGCEVVFDNVNFDDAPGEGDPIALVGDFSGVTANYPEGEDVKIVVDPYTSAKADKVEFIAKLYVGIGVTRPASFALISLKAGG
ncbi:MAG: phage major capsid protein [Clostridiales bacterium]|nr:phage major capsid protein [Clostridiales bacterium]MBQ1572543.1 phage major capsid protein [Clostridiales bacterium]